MTVTRDKALADARSADAARAAGRAGRLTGVPLAHKDIFCTDGIRTSCGSKMLDNFVAPYDATVVEKLAAAGTVLLGKTNMDEFAAPTRAARSASRRRSSASPASSRPTAAYPATG